MCLSLTHPPLSLSLSLSLSFSHFLSLSLSSPSLSEISVCISLFFISNSIHLSVFVLSLQPTSSFPSNLSFSFSLFVYFVLFRLICLRPFPSYVIVCVSLLCHAYIIISIHPPLSLPVCLSLSLASLSISFLTPD